MEKQKAGGDIGSAGAVSFHCKQVGKLGVTEMVALGKDLKQVRQQVCRSSGGQVPRHERAKNPVDPEWGKQGSRRDYEGSDMYDCVGTSQTLDFYS